MDLRSRKLTAQQANSLINKFAKAVGDSVMQDAYGWSSVNDVLSAVDEIWAFDDSGVRNIGFGMLSLDTNDALDDEAVLVVGVFPKYQRKGYHAAILEWMAQHAKSLGAACASMTVKKTNEAHYRRTMRRAHADDNPWIYAGDNWYPAPGYAYFVYPLEKPDEEEKDDAPTVV